MTMIEGGAAGRKRTFQMRADALSLGDDYWIEDEAGTKAFRVNGKVARMRDTWVLEDAAGREVARIREKKLSIRDKVKIELADGVEATVRKALVGIRDRFVVEMDGRTDLKVHGKVLDHEYDVDRDGDGKIAEISKKWFRVRDTYGVEVEHDEDSVLVLAVTVAVDALAHGDD
jgi:uncharacterized protein YxjI